MRRRAPDRSNVHAPDRNMQHACSCALSRSRARSLPTRTRAGHPSCPPPTSAAPPARSTAPGAPCNSDTVVFVVGVVFGGDVAKYLPPVCHVTHTRFFVRLRRTTSPRARRPQVYAALNGVLQGWGRAGRWGKNDDRRAVVLAGFSAGVLKSMAPFTTTPRCVSQLLAVLRVLFLTPGCVRMAVLEEMGAAEDAQAIQVAANGCCGRCSRCLPPTVVQFALAAPVDVTDEVSGLLRLVWAHGQHRRRPALGHVLHPTGPWARNLAWVKPGRGVHATLAVAHCLVHGLLNIEAVVGGGGVGTDGETKRALRHHYRLWIDADDHPSGDPCVRNTRVLAIMRGLEVVRIWLR